MKDRLWIVACAALFAACGAETGADAGEPVWPTPTVIKVPDQPTESVQTSTLDGPGEITALASSGGVVYVGTNLGLHRVVSGGLEDVTPWPIDGVSAYVGAVKAMDGEDGTLVVAAEGGIFHLQGAALLRSPASDVVGDLEIDDVAAAGDDLWVAADEGLFRVRAEALESWSVGTAGAVAATAAAGESLLIGHETGEGYVMNTGSMEVEWLPGGRTASVGAATSGGLAIDGDGGLVVRAEDGAWSSWATGQILALASGAGNLGVVSEGGLYSLATVNGAWVLEPLGSVEGLGAVTAATMNGDGDIFTATGSTLTQWHVGTPVTFGEVQSVFTSNCAWCHNQGLQGAPVRDFEDYDVVISMLEPITEWIALDLMPPAAFGTVPTADEELLVRWIQGGTLP